MKRRSNMPKPKRIDPETGGVGRIIQDAANRTGFTPVPQGQGINSAFGGTPASQQPAWPTPQQSQPTAEPVPQKWNEWAGWWGRRQVDAVKDWWQKAEREVWGEEKPTTPQDEFWGRMAAPLLGMVAGAQTLKDEPTAENLWDYGASSLKTTLKTPGALVAAGKAAPGLGGRIFTAFEQATRGVTGAIAGGFDILDVGIMEQGILGVGAEIVAPMLQGRQIDFTPQEFEAGRNRYTRWWTAISKGQSASDELYNLTMERIREGAQPEDIDADSVLSNPVAELAGRLVLDPTNMIPASWGKRIRMIMGKSSAAKLFAMEDLADYEKVWEAEKALGAANAARGRGFKGFFYTKLHPLRRDNASLAGQMVETAVLTLGQALEGATEPGDIGKIIRSFILAGGKDEAAKAAQGFLKGRGTLPVSKAGKRTTGLLREMITDPKTKEIDFGILKGWFEDAKSDNDAIRRMLAGLDKTMERVYPTGKVGTVKAAQNKYRGFLTQYMYLGWNPGASFRNAASNTSMGAIAGYRPFTSADKVEEFAQRWGSTPFLLREGFGAPGSEFVTAELRKAIIDLGMPYDAVRLKDLPSTVIEDLAKNGIKGAPAMRLSNAFEQASSERIIHQALEFFWKEHWRPSLPDDIRRLFPTRLQADAFESMLADAVNLKEIDGALGASRLGRKLGDEWEEALSRFPGALRREVLRARLEASDAADFGRRMTEIGGRADEWLTKTLNDLGPEIAKNDELVHGAVRADRELLERIEDAGEAEEIAGYLKNDTFEKQLAIDRGNDMAMGELLRRHSKASPDPEVKNAITDLLVNHQQTGPETSGLVDLARQKAWAEHAVSDATERSRIWGEYFEYRDAMWRQYWDDFTRKGEDFLSTSPAPTPMRGGAPPPAPSRPVPTPPTPQAGTGLARPPDTGAGADAAKVGGVEPGARRSVPGVVEEGLEPAKTARITETESFKELRDELVERLTPTRQAVAAISTKDTKKVLDELASAAPTWNWDDLPGMEEESLAGVRKWLDEELIPRFHETKVIANKAALGERDFVLYNYSDRRHFDNALSYLYPYHYWYSRTAMNVPRMLMYNPKVLARYLDYKDFVKQLNEEAQGLPWWEQQLKVPGTDYYFNLEATLNPLYSIMNDFHDPEKTATPQGQWLERLGNVGPSLDVLYWALYAAWRAHEGEPEEALASMGYLGQPTKAFRYATALMGVAGGKGVTLEPWMWDDPFSFQGLDKWERRRVGHHLYQLVEEGKISREQAWDAGKKQNGPEWDEAVARMTTERGPGMFSSLLLGVGLKPRKGYEIQVDKALHAEREFYAHAAESFDMSTDEGQELYRQGQRELYEYYPFLGYVKLVRRGELERDQAYTWEVLRRIPPGSIGFQVKQSVGLDDPTVDKFYETMGEFEGWADMDRANFMAKIEALGAALGVPDKARVGEWDKARGLYYQVKDDLRQQFGEDIFEIQSTYYDVREVAGKDAADVILEANPQLRAFWQERSKYISNSDTLMSYWGSVDMLENMARGILNEQTEAGWPGYEEVQAGYFKFTKDTKSGRAARRAYLKQYPWLKDVWDFRDKTGEQLAQMVEEMTAEMTPPLGPVLRPDADLTSVLVQRAEEIVKARYESGAWVKGRVGEEMQLKEEPVTPLDIEGENVVNLESSSSLLPTTRKVRSKAPPKSPRSVPSKPSTKSFSWQSVREMLGRDLSEKLIGVLYQGRSPTGDLRSRLETIYSEFPIGFTEFDQWLDFLRLMWRASITTRSSGGAGGTGFAKRPRPLYGSSRSGSGRRYVPWG
ncbi:MAG: hypothetical protein DRQ02_02620 [Candidatus Latescibacterota bacterium]|nr:MAG: hypothetical protein DRQ02_02620 [Candidatus Latescibacterota bacterium]